MAQNQQALTEIEYSNSSRMASHGKLSRSLYHFKFWWAIYGSVQRFRTQKLM